MYSPGPGPVMDPPPYTEQEDPPPYEPPPYDDIVYQPAIAMSTFSNNAPQPPYHNASGEQQRPSLNRPPSLNQPQSQHSLIDRPNSERPSSVASSHSRHHPPSEIIMSPSALYDNRLSQRSTSMLHDDTFDDTFDETSFMEQLPDDSRRLSTPQPLDSRRLSTQFPLPSSQSSSQPLSALGVADIGLSLVAQTGSNVRPYSRPSSYQMQSRPTSYSSTRPASSIRNSNLSTIPVRAHTSNERQQQQQNVSNHSQNSHNAHRWNRPSSRNNSRNQTSSPNTPQQAPSNQTNSEQPQNATEIVQHHQRVLSRQRHEPNIILDDLNADQTRPKDKSKPDISKRLVQSDKEEVPMEGNENLAYIESLSKSNVSEA